MSRATYRSRRSLLAVLVAVAVIGTAGSALAFFTAGNSGSAAALGGTLNAGNTPSGSATGSSVTISWAATTAPPGHALDGYTIGRWDAASGGTFTSSLNGCSSTVNALTCTETGVPDGTWYYTVTPKLANWFGAESGRSSGIVVTTAALATKLAFTQSPSSSIAGTAFSTQPQVTVEDATSSPVVGDSSTVTLAITSGTGTAGAALSGCIQTGESNGVVSFSGCSIDRAGTGYKLHATDGSLTPADSGTFNVSPSVTSVAPNGGPTTSGASVVITGTGFTGTTPASGVKFGTNAATGVVVNSNTQITAIAPAHAAGAVDVTVTNATLTSATSAADTYNYEGAPTVTSVTPNGGPIGGGTSVTVTGTNFFGTSAVNFGTGNPGTSIVVNGTGTSLTVTSPAHATGQVDVRVTTPVNQSVTSANDKFNYEGAPTVTAVSPTVGDIAGGTSVTITGTNFFGTTEVDFGPSNPGTSIVINSGTSITVTSPSGAAGQVDVTVTTPVGNSATVAADHFNYVMEPTITAPTVAVPCNPGHNGTTSCVITGTNFEVGVIVTGNGSATVNTATRDSSTQITVNVTGHGGNGAAGSFTVLNPDGGAVTSASGSFKNG